MEFSKQFLAPAGSTGNNTHQGISNRDEGGVVALQFVVEAVGATPTVTFKWQGSLDGQTWNDLTYVSTSTDTLTTSTQTVTGVGTTTVFLENSQQRNWAQFRLVTSANTNVTYRSELYTQATN